jgi:hypothetical protein
MELEELATWSIPARRTLVFVLLLTVEWFGEAEPVGESLHPMSDP